MLTTNPDIVAARRRWWYKTCSTLNLNDDAQRKIADELIPDDHPFKFKLVTLEISRNPLFTDLPLWIQAKARLVTLLKSRRITHRRLDGSKGPRSASLAQIIFARQLARKIGWNDKGEDHLDLRLQQFCSRQSNDGRGSIRLFASWSSADARRVIDALKQMRSRLQNTPL